ncbi:MAG: hypothetical protein C4335_05670 [Armatimonadota bacterium]
MTEFTWKHFFITLAMMAALFVVGILLLATLRPYSHSVEERLREHRQIFQRWLEADTLQSLKNESIIRYRVLGEVALPKCAQGCTANTFQLSEYEHWCMAFWKHDGVIVRVLLAYRSEKGRKQAAESLQQAHSLLGKQLETGNRPLYDPDQWLRTGKLRLDAKITVPSHASWFVVFRSDFTPPGLVWCYWEADSRGRIVRKGLYGS